MLFESLRGNAHIPVFVCARESVRARVCLCVMKLHKHAHCCILIRDNKTSIKDLFRRGEEGEGREGEGHSGLCQRVDYAKDTHTHLSPPRHALTVLVVAEWSSGVWGNAAF